MATDGPRGGYAQASGGPAYPGRAADRLGPVGLSLDALDGLREPIDLDAELTHRLVELPGRMRQTVHVLLDRLDHLGDGSLPLFEQLHAGAFDLLAEVPRGPEVRYGASRPPRAAQIY